jgi:GTP pyrophosphokinase
VASRAASLGLEEDELLAAALLHDVCEDCGVTPEELPAGERVQQIVKLLTKTYPHDLSDGDKKKALKEYFEGAQFKQIRLIEWI